MECAEPPEPVMLCNCTSYMAIVLVTFSLLGENSWHMEVYNFSGFSPWLASSKPQKAWWKIQAEERCSYYGEQEVERGTGVIVGQEYTFLNCAPVTCPVWPDSIHKSEALGDIFDLKHNIQISNTLFTQENLIPRPSWPSKVNYIFSVELDQ